MLDVSRVIPSVVIRSILVVASLILIMQIGLFTWFAISDCSKEPPIEEIGTAEELQAVLWCVYEGKIIKILPTAADICALSSVLVSSWLSSMDAACFVIAPPLETSSLCLKDTNGDVLPASSITQHSYFL